MARDLRKHIELYDKKYLDLKKNRSGAGCFFVTDYKQIEEMSGGKIGQIIDNALKAGFIIGYNRAKAEKKKESKHLEA